MSPFVFSFLLVSLANGLPILFIFSLSRLTLCLWYHVSVQLWSWDWCSWLLHTFFLSYHSISFLSWFPDNSLSFSSQNIVYLFFSWLLAIRESWKRYFYPAIFSSSLLISWADLDVKVLHASDLNANDSYSYHAMFSYYLHLEPHCEHLWLVD
jgi:hypothetical protein